MLESTIYYIKKKNQVSSLTPVLMMISWIWHRKQKEQKQK